MKKLFTCILFLGFSSLFAQKWALPTSEWTIRESSSFSSESNTFKVKVDGDTTILGQTCQKLSNGMVTFERNDTIFVHHQGRFHSVMYWNANVNDIVPIFDYYGVQVNGHNEASFSDTVMAKITLIDSIDVGNKYVKQFHFEIISPSYIANNDLTYAENIGSNYILPYFYYNFILDGDGYSLCDYGDSTIQDFYVYNANCNNISTKEEQKFAFSLFPNPTSDFIHLQLENTENVNYSITDITGKVIAQNAWNRNPISIENLHSGVYFITLLNKSEIVGTQELVKI